MNESLTSREILSAPEDIQRLVRRNKILLNKYMIVKAAPNGQGTDRIFATVARTRPRISGVARNYLRRLGKELFRRNKTPSPKAGIDIGLFLFPAIRTIAHTERTAIYRNALHGAHSRLEQIGGAGHG